MVAIPVNIGAVNPTAGRFAALGITGCAKAADVQHKLIKAILIVVHFI
jgi:hypothetical protein